MKKTLNILAILFFIACTNATKSITYSEIVTSLLEMSDDREDALLNVNTITENFMNSNHHLENLNLRVTTDCNNMSERGSEHLAKLNAKIESHRSTIAHLKGENKKIADAIVSDENSIKSEVEKIRQTKQDKDAAKAEVVNAEKAILESINVLKRLKNLAIDELQGAQIKSTEMHRYNVTITTPPAFIQFSEFHGELKSLLSKTDSMNRGFISTLILLTQSVGKQTYSNPETVRKIVSMIDKVLANTYEKIQQNLQQSEEKIGSYTNMINNSRTLIARLKDEVARNVNVRANNQLEVVFFTNDIIFLEKAVARREKRNVFTNKLCQEQMSLIKKHYRRYEETLNQVGELRRALADQ